MNLDPDLEFWKTNGIYRIHLGSIAVSGGFRRIGVPVSMILVRTNP